jgi:soluble lytic murein transglycosylase-like protein
MSGPMDVIGRVAQRVGAIEQQLQELHPVRVLETMFGQESFGRRLQQQVQAELARASESGAGTTATTERWVPAIEKYATHYGVDPAVVRAVMQAESGGYERSVSPKGAMGLMQLMPGTAEQLGVSDPFDPDENIRGGVAYLGDMLQRFGDLPRALAAYNAGPGAVERHGGVPPYAETERYVDQVLGYIRNFNAGR